MSDSTAPEWARLALSWSQVQRLCTDLPRSCTLDDAMQIIESMRQEAMGPGLLTVHQNLSVSRGSSEAGNPDVMVLQRLWTSQADSYPVGGRKYKKRTPWSDQLLCRAEVYVGEGVEALRQVFDDHALIESLGLQAVVNVPLLDSQLRCFATFNVLGTAPRWSAQERMLISLLARLATPLVERAVVNETGWTKPPGVHA